MGKTIKLYIDGVEKHFIKLHYRKDHPNPDPDMFEITMDENEAVDVVTFQTVEIKKDEVTEFYGFVEEITPDEDAESGTDIVVTGRCWKLILWKKFNERFQESREVGPMDYEGNIETGFFGSVSPTELFKFILRSPMSVHPKGKIRHKFGWGIPSDTWGCCANETAESRYPDWVGLRYNGLAWRGRGQVLSEFYTDVLVCNSFDATYTTWAIKGASPYLDTNDEDGSWIRKAVFMNDVTEGDFGFPNLDGSRVTVYEAKLTLNFYGYGRGAGVQVFLYDGTLWNNIGYLDNHASAQYGGYYANQTFIVSTILNTPTKVNAAKIRFYANGNPYVNVYISYAYLECKTGTSGVTDVQKDEDWFAVNLGQTYDRVTAILVECRNNAVCYPENYKIQYTTLSNCCDPDYPPSEDDWEDFNPAVNVTSNIYRDILHSWQPADNVYGIRIKITADGARPWEISQIYIWQADTLRYRLMNED